MTDLTPISPNFIPVSKPYLLNEALPQVRRILSSGHLREGDFTGRFEELFISRTNAKYGFAVSSGTAALHIANLLALKPGDEVIVPSFTFIASASSVFLSGGVPVLVDVDSETFLLDLEKVNEAISSRTRAIMPVHLFGNMLDLKFLGDLADDHGLLLINDCAQALGSRYRNRELGEFEHINCYSFYPTKIITTGEGGMITINDSSFFQRGRMLKNHGEERKYFHSEIGLNYRINEVQAAIGLSQLGFLDDFLEKRKWIARKYSKAIEKIDGLSIQKITAGVDSCFNYYSVVLDTDRFRCVREEFVGALRRENIGCGVHYPLSLNKQPAILKKISPMSCPVAEFLCENIFSIPMHAALSDEEVDLVLGGLERVVSTYSI